MVEKWMSLHDGAAMLEVSLRTVQRRIRDGTLRSRRGVLGRREVLLDVAASDSENVHQALQMVQDQLALLRDRADGADGSVAPLASNSTGDRRLTRARRVAVAGWVLAAILSVVAGGAIRYAANAARRAERGLSGDVAATLRLQERIDRLTVERDSLRRERDALTAEGVPIQLGLAGSEALD